MYAEPCATPWGAGGLPHCKRLGTHEVHSRARVVLSSYRWKSGAARGDHPQRAFEVEDGADRGLRTQAKPQPGRARHACCMLIWSSVVAIPWRAIVIASVYGMCDHSTILLVIMSSFSAMEHSCVWWLPCVRSDRHLRNHCVALRRETSRTLSQQWKKRIGDAIKTCNARLPPTSDPFTPEFTLEPSGMGGEWVQNHYSTASQFRSRCPFACSRIASERLANASMRSVCVYMQLWCCARERTLRDCHAWT